MVLGTINTNDPGHAGIHNAERSVINELDTNAVRKTLYDAKGDILIGSANDTPAKLGPVGANGTILIADSAQPLGVRWSSGNRFFSGTGNPNGVLSAPVGSRYIDTNATNGGVEWLKSSGAGNTGWTIANGDTGTRDISSLLANGWTATQIRIRRIDGWIHLMATGLVATNATSDTVMILPTGFRPHQATRFNIIDITINRTLMIDGTGNVRVLSYATSDGSLDAIQATYPNTTTGAGNDWPASLPGSAV